MKKDELNNFNVNNSDGMVNVSESSLNKIKEVNNVPEIKKSTSEVFQSSEENKIGKEDKKKSFDSGSNSSDSATKSSSASGVSGVGAVGGAIGVVAVSAALVVGVVHLPTIPAIDVHLIAATSSSLAFSFNTNIEDHSKLLISLKGIDYEISTPFQEYVKFTDLRMNEEYTLSVNDEETSRYNSSFYTNDKEDISNITITVTSYIDDKLYFYFEDSEEGDKLYTVTVKNKSGKEIYLDETKTPKEYEIDNFVEDVAIFVAVDGVINAGVQVFKPIYDYEHIEWIWGEYGETVTAIIPSTNDTDDYYVRDIRNFEIDRKDATCLEDGYVIRQAAFIGPDKNRYEDQKEFTLPALGHDFSEVTYTWSDSYHICKAESICSHCESKIEESVEVVVEEVTTTTNISFTKYTATFENENFSTRTHYEDLVYGTYPQSIVTDESIVDELNEMYYIPSPQRGDWISYDYYASSSSETPYMYYIDVDYDDDGEFDYRGVHFTSYRPISTTDELGNSSYQYDNGYLVDTNYWFNYDPIKWDVIDQGDGQLFITSDIILDSQSFYHEMSEEEFIHNDGSGFANNYELSDIRSWLNETFYASAFADDSAIVTTSVDNSLASTLDSANPYICNDTEDKVFLLSREELSENLPTSELSVTGSDYAKCQGLYVAKENDKGFWALRTPRPNEPYQLRYITNNGSISYDSITKTSLGVRPACWINIDQR